MRQARHLSGGSGKSDFYMYGRTDGERKSLYGAALIASEPAEIERKPRVNGNVVTVLIDSGASGDYFGVLIILEFQHRPQDYISLTMPRTILTAGGALLDGTAEGELQGLITIFSR